MSYVHLNNTHKPTTFTTHTLKTRKTSTGNIIQMYYSVVAHSILFSEWQMHTEREWAKHHYLLRIIRLSKVVLLVQTLNHTDVSLINS